MSDLLSTTKTEDFERLLEQKDIDSWLQEETSLSEDYLYEYNKNEIDSSNIDSSGSTNLDFSYIEEDPEIHRSPTASGEHFRCILVYEERKNPTFIKSDKFIGEFMENLKIDLICDENLVKGREVVLTFTDSVNKDFELVLTEDNKFSEQLTLGNIIEAHKKYQALHKLDTSDLLIMVSLQTRFISRFQQFFNDSEDDKMLESTLDGEENIENSNDDNNNKSEDVVLLNKEKNPKDSNDNKLNGDDLINDEENTEVFIKKEEELTYQDFDDLSEHDKITSISNDIIEFTDYDNKALDELLDAGRNDDEHTIVEDNIHKNIEQIDVDNNEFENLVAEEDKLLESTLDYEENTEILNNNNNNNDKLDDYDLLINREENIENLNDNDRLIRDNLINEENPEISNKNISLDVDNLMSEENPEISNKNISLDVDDLMNEENPEISNKNISLDVDDLINEENPEISNENISLDVDDLINEENPEISNKNISLDVDDLISEENPKDAGRNDDEHTIVEDNIHKNIEQIEMDNNEFENLVAEGDKLLESTLDYEENTEILNNNNNNNNNDKLDDDDLLINREENIENSNDNDRLVSDNLINEENPEILNKNISLDVDNLISEENLNNDNIRSVSDDLINEGGNIESSDNNKSDNDALINDQDIEIIVKKEQQLTHQDFNDFSEQLKITSIPNDITTLTDENNNNILDDVDNLNVGSLVDASDNDNDHKIVEYNINKNIEQIDEGNNESGKFDDKIETIFKDGEFNENEATSISGNDSYEIYNHQRSQETVFDVDDYAMNNDFWIDEEDLYNGGGETDLGRGRRGGEIELITNEIELDDSFLAIDNNDPRIDNNGLRIDGFNISRKRERSPGPDNEGILKKRINV